MFEKRSLLFIPIFVILIFGSACVSPRQSDDFLCVTTIVPDPDQESVKNIIDKALALYDRMAEYSAAIETKRVSITINKGTVGQSFSAEQSNQFLNIGFKRNGENKLTWETHTPISIDCQGLSVLDQCGKKLNALSDKGWCSCIKEEILPGGDHLLVSSGQINSGKSGGEVVRETPNGKKENIKIATFDEGIKKLEKLENHDLNLIHLVLKDGHPVFLHQKAINNLELSLETKSNGQESYKISGSIKGPGKLVSTGLNPIAGDLTEVTFTIWIKKEDFLITRIEIVSRANNTAIYWIENHNNINYKLLP